MGRGKDYTGLQLIEEAQTICQQLLMLGVEMDNDRIDKFIICFADDEWAKDSLERKYYMDYAIKCLEKYKYDKTPVDIDIEYDFEHYFIPKPYSKPEIDEVKSILKSVLECDFTLLRDEFSLLVLVSNEDFTRLDGLSVFGVKLVTNFEKL